MGDLIDKLRGEADIYASYDVITQKLLTDAADALASLQAERDALRTALIQAGRASGAILADTVSTEFLLLVPVEVQARLAAVEAERDAAREVGSCELCAGKCRGHSLGDRAAWKPEPGSRAHMRGDAP